MSDDQRSIDWARTTFDGSRRDQLRQMQRLTVRQRLEALEQLTELSERLRAMPRRTAEPHAAMGAHEPPAEYSGAADATAALPAYTGTALAGMDATTLIAHLREHADRAPRDLMDACAGRGDAMVEALERLLDAPAFWADDTEDGDWWLRLHTAMILGLIPTEAAGRQLVELMRKLDAADDEDTQDRLADYWPALFANKPAALSHPLRALMEDRSLDGYIRVNALGPYLAFTRQENGVAFETALDWVGEIATDETEERYVRFNLANTLIDFPRDRHRALLERLAAQQPKLGRYFDTREIEDAYARGEDRPDWERFTDPWKFYTPEASAARQQRWKEKDREHTGRNEDYDDLPLWPETYIREGPKIGVTILVRVGAGRSIRSAVWTRGVEKNR